MAVTGDKAQRREPPNLGGHKGFPDEVKTLRVFNGEENQLGKDRGARAAFQAAEKAAV